MGTTYAVRQVVIHRGGRADVATPVEGLPVQDAADQCADYYHEEAVGRLSVAVAVLTMTVEVDEKDERVVAIRTTPNAATLDTPRLRATPFRSVASGVFASGERVGVAVVLPAHDNCPPVLTMPDTGDLVPLSDMPSLRGGQRGQ
jgi:hypothetical protein